MKFSLLSEPWVPVTVAGERREVSLRDALVEAHRLDGIAFDSPLEAAAVFRQVLLPAAIHAFGVPRTTQQWRDRYEAGYFDPGAVDEYLGSWAERFDLFHPTRPFAQVADLRTPKGETKPISLLIPHAATGNNVPLFSARTDADPPALTPAAAARTLLAVQCWDTGAIKSGAVGDPKVTAGKTTGNPTGPLGQLGLVLPMTRTLFGSLLLNVPVLDAGLDEHDGSQWANDAAVPAWESRPARGLLDLLTWQARRIRLIPEVADAGPEVRSAVLCAGDRLDGAWQDIEPHTAWRVAEAKKPEPNRPIRHQPDRAAWRGLAALLVTEQRTDQTLTAPAVLIHISRLRRRRCLPADLPLHARIVGVAYGTQFAVIDDVIADYLPLPVQALLDETDNSVRECLLQVVDQAESLRVATNRLGDDIRAAMGVEKAPWDKGQRPGEVLVHAFTPSVRRLLRGLQHDPEDADRGREAWETVARRLAWSVAEPLLNAVPATAYLGRKLDQPYPARLAAAEATFRRRLNEILGPLQTPAGAGGRGTTVEVSDDHSAPVG